MKILCPKCGKIGALHGRGRVFSCDCGLQAEYRENGLLAGDIPFASIPEWDAWQQDQLREMGQKPDFFLSDEDAELRELEMGHRVRVLARGVLRLDAEGIAVDALRISLAHMQDPSLCHFGNGETMMFTAEGRNYELCFPRGRGVQPPSIRKYQLMLELLREATAVGKEAQGA